MVPTTALVEPIVPAPEVLSYVTQRAVDPVLVDGEVMLGATLPAAVPVYSIPVRLTSIPTSTGRGSSSNRAQDASSTFSDRSPSVGGDEFPLLALSGHRCRR